MRGNLVGIEIVTEIQTIHLDIVQKFDSFVARFSRSYLRCATVHVARPTHSILDFGRNDKSMLVVHAILRCVIVDLIFRARA
jgi:hypothetical protein